MNRVVIAIVLFLAFVSMTLAHEGHDHNIMGTVALLHENHLEVKSAKDGKAVTVTLADKTKFVRDKAPAKRDELQVGMRVVVTYAQEKDPSGREILAAKEVRLGAASGATGR